jgi:hypothetical protein
VPTTARGRPAFEHNHYMHRMRRGAPVPEAPPPVGSPSVFGNGSPGCGSASVALPPRESSAALSCSVWKTTIGDRLFRAICPGWLSGCGGIVHMKSPRQQYRFLGIPTRSQASRSVSAVSLLSKFQYWSSFAAITRPQVKHRTGGRSVMAGLWCVALPPVAHRH